MKQLKSYKTVTFADGNYRIDIMENKTMFEAWICHKDYGVKSLMFGCPKKQTIGTFTMDMFLQMVENNLPEYKQHYAMEYED